jgi:hypothetical protein
LSVVLIPILSFFFLKDGAAIYAALLDSAGDRMRSLLAEILDGLHDLFARYIRSVVLLSGATFVSHSAFFTITGVPYPILLASIAAILEFIPVVGPLSAAVVTLLVSALAGYGHLLWILVFLILYRLFQDYVLLPYLMSSGVEIHPLVVLFGVLAGEQAADQGVGDLRVVRRARALDRDRDLDDRGGLGADLARQPDRALGVEPRVGADLVLEARELEVLAGRVDHLDEDGEGLAGGAVGLLDAEDVDARARGRAARGDGDQAGERQGTKQTSM